jgi:hypothetical protein
MTLSGMDGPDKPLDEFKMPKYSKGFFDDLNPKREERKRTMPTKELKFQIELTVKSTRGISYDRALVGILQMEINANLAGDPRYHFTKVVEVKEKEES